MKTLRFFYLLLCGIMLQGLTCTGYAQSPIPGYDDFPVSIDAEHFPDEYFRHYVSQFDDNEDGLLSRMEVDDDNEQRFELYDRDIRDLEGIKYFFSLDYLTCNNNQLTSLDVSGCTDLDYLTCDNNQLTSLDVSGCTDLGSLSCDNNQLTSLDVSGCTDLGSLSCDNNQLTSLDVSGYTKLFRLYCDNNRLTSLDVSGCTELFRLYCSNNQLTILDVSGHTGLDELYCSNNQLTSLDVRGCGYLSVLDCSNNRLETINVLANSSLRRLFCDSNQLRNLDLSANLELRELNCSYNHLTSLDVIRNTNLDELYAEGNYLDVSVDDEKRYNLKQLSEFNMDMTYDWQGGYVEDSLLCFEETIVTYGYYTGVKNGDTIHFALRSAIPVNEDNFPDEAFRAYVSGSIDVSHDGNLNEGEINSMTTMDVSGLGIRSLQGIEYFTALESLDCSDNELASLDLSANTKLQNLNAVNNCLDVVLDSRNSMSISILPNFDAKRASDWDGAILILNTLRFSQQEVTYQYSTAYAGESENENLQSVLFTLVADRNPSVGNEVIEDQPQGRVYAKDRTLFTEGLSGEVSVFTTVGTLVYQGQSNRIPVRQAGIYIVRNSGNTWKLLVM